MVQSIVRINHQAAVDDSALMITKLRTVVADSTALKKKLSYKNLGDKIISNKIHIWKRKENMYHICLVFATVQP